MEIRKYTLKDVLEFGLVTLIPILLEFVNLILFYDFLFGDYLASKITPLFCCFSSITIVFALLYSYRLEYCNLHRKIMWITLAIQSSNFIVSVNQQVTILINCILIILHYKLAVALIKLGLTFLTQSKTIKKLNTIIHASQRHSKI